jgi:polyisoprenoid-binding protein YceI
MAFSATRVRNCLRVQIAMIFVATMQAPLQAAPVSYVVDPKHTYASFEIDHLGLSTARGTFDRTTGKLTLDPAAATGHIEIVIDTGSVNTGLAKRDQHLRAAAFFNVNQYPTMTYEATSLRFDGDTLTGADGHLTLLGRTLPVSLEVTRFSCAQHPIYKKPACGADAVTTIRRSEWGMTAYVPTIGDNVTIRIGIEVFRLP